jgi:hypothetical protein
VAIDQLSNGWRSYRDAIDRFYEIARPALDGGWLLEGDLVRQADVALDAVAKQSQTLSEIGEGLLRDRSNREHDEIAVLLLAAAAVDSMIAYDGLRVGPAPLELDPEFADRASVAEVEPFDVIVGEADALFGPLMGGNPVGGGQEVDRGELLAECNQALDTLVDVATGPASRFGFGAVTAGVAPLTGFAVANVVGKLDHVTSLAGLIKRHAVRLLREGVRKVVTVAGEQSVEWGLERLREALRSPGTRLLEAIAGRSVAETRVSAVIGRPGELAASQVALVRVDVGALTTAYAEQMKWTGRIASGISILAPLISTLAAPVGGPALVIGLDGIGLGFVLYTLTVRLDGRSLPARVEGVATIVERL